MSAEREIYNAHSILPNFADGKSQRIDWFKLMDYQDDPYFPWPNPDEMSSEDDWSRLIADYIDLDRRERWIARHYASQFFTRFALEDIRGLVEREFETTISVEAVSIPLCSRTA